jgi:tetratricopeptide (TPR) repeat protein
MRTAARIGHLAHDLVMAGAIGLLVVCALLLSTRSVGYPSRAESALPIPDIESRTASDRAMAIFRFSLLCLDASNRGRLKEAIADCDKALLLDPARTDLLILRGNIEAMDGRLAEAVRDYTRVTMLAPSEPAAYRNRGATYMLMKRDKEALADFARALKLVPGDPSTLELRGHYYQLHDRPDLAIVEYTAALAGAPGVARLWNSRCWARVTANREVKAALADCNESIRLDPRSSFAHDSRGFALLRLERYREAIGSFGRALALQPRLASSLFGRGLARLSLHDTAGLRDVAAAKAIEPGIESRLGRYGFRLPTRFPSGA